MISTLKFLQVTSFTVIVATVFCSYSCNKPISESSETMKPETEEIARKGDVTLPTSAEVFDKIIAFGEGDFKYSVEDFFRNPEKTALKISPVGDYFSFLGPYENRMNIFVRQIGQEDAVRITSETGRDIMGYMWANNNRLLYIKDSAGDENYRLFAVNKDGTERKDLTPFEGVKIQMIDDLEDIEDEVIIGMNKRNPQSFDPYRLNVNTGEMELLYENPGNITGWMTDHKGRLRIAITTDGVNSTLLHRKTEKEPFRKVITLDFIDKLSPLFFTFDNKNIYALSSLNRDKIAVVEFDLETGKEIGKPIFIHPDVDVGNLNFSRKRQLITCVTYVTDRRQYHFIDDKTRDVYNRVKSELPAYEVLFRDYNRDENKYLIRTFSDRSMGSYYLYNLVEDELVKLAEISPWLNEDDMAEMKPVKYKSRDGLTIHGYLTLPKGRDDLNNLPVVVNPHGGPWARNSWGYNPEVQLLASRGYAVMQMNFRGSTGYGKEFWKASFKEWGKAMQDDITDGVYWLIDQGIADPERIAIYGGSYGGYASLAGVAFTPDLYACAIDFVGVANIFTFLETIPPYWEPFLEMMYEMVGDPGNPVDSANLYASSPVFHVESIKTPLLIVQGANDPRVNINESDQMVRALRERGVEVPYMVKYDEGHGFRNEENRIRFYQVMIGFLAKHLNMTVAEDRLSMRLQ